MADHATFTVTTTLKDGTAASHTAEAIRYWLEADGAVVIEAACCGLVGGVENCPNCEGATCARCGGSGRIKKEDTRSRHAFYDISGAPLSDGNGGMSQVDPESEVRAHVERVARRHAAVHRTRSFSLDSLMKPAAK
jgi:hypothetical protein